ncbi:MAG: bifunctional 5,10-methylenetetrahydrofolate dehydrogenase/5,10-methenyltetrahydrofolate cyclohydrolase [Acidimicrobiia bacterium]|nr:bifunctional 5,10-methylenetetrahydrofolate dehydrogenase/5,10-methenyltetrahydrofolate cyclohydrolase [Acidimicrobiia bacterium]NNF68698.1 bifunctional 5,10-methylenetetrahydrofolate dehydrogenase/5,10-methenyltetrahydrofolate cyclohydrolase [Acidimicrobiia bacterium]NNK90925.1 bifunctional 5,10-methylenetetrahydrofolate dehydrogenase/5,10-methenyltetrahydrofolate cyclohydrolase [Acidimicrobiia bacterium]
MTARIIDGKQVAAEVRAEVAREVKALAEDGTTVGLATVLVGADPGSRVYVASKHRAAVAAGMLSVDRHLPETATQQEVESVIRELNADPGVSGMILQLPLPDGLDGDAAVEIIDPAKDADGLHPFSLGRLLLSRPAPVAATPQGIMRLLDHYDIETPGKKAVIVGRSFLVGRPLAMLLGAKGVDATVVMTHSRTVDLAAEIASADILVVAIGRPGFVDGTMIKPGATVIDVGINRTDDGIVGDVDFESAVEVAGAITPVPGGVGPMTVACLLANTVRLATQTDRQGRSGH